MKLVDITLSVALLGLLSIASADTTATVNTTASVDAQIEKIQSATPQERVELMNQFKQKLMQMNQDDRMAAIQDMQSKMHAKADAANQYGKDTSEMAKNMMSDRKHKMDNMSQSMDKEHMQEMQMQSNEHMTQMQNKMQQQAGNQFMQCGGAGNQNMQDSGTGTGSQFMQGGGAENHNMQGGGAENQNMQSGGAGAANNNMNMTNNR